jgi:hypothetical protein
MAKHVYETTALGYGRLTQVQLAEVLGIPPSRVGALQSWPLPAEDADKLAILIQLQK